MQPFTFFISYRRQDTAPIALLLKHEIEKRLQFVRVAVDVDTLQPGEPFPDRLQRLIGGAHAVVALIGPRWMPPAKAAAGGRATKAPPADDWVARELAYAKEAPLAMPKADRHALKERAVIPLFVDAPRDFRPFALPPGAAYLAERHAEHIEAAAWPSDIGPLVDRLAVALGLKKRPDADQYPRPNAAKARTQPLGDAELEATLAYDDYAGWYIDNFGNAEVRYLVKTFQFHGFSQAAAFMAMVAEHCKVLNHHPEWRNVFDQVTVSLTTWDAKRRVTIYDLNLALYMNMAARRIAGKGVAAVPAP